MANRIIVNQQSDSPNHLKSIVEQSLGVLREGKESEVAAAQKRPLRRRSLPIHFDVFNRERRALLEAAKALATLWKIPEPRRVKL